jgi:hypothetical protein
MTTNIYILQLEDNNYYIGYTEDIKKKIQSHIDGTGASFTKLHKPISIIKVYENVSPLKVDKYIIKYMQKYGINNVRGGLYKNIELKSSQIKELEKAGVVYKKNKKKLIIDEIDTDDLQLDDIIIDNTKKQKVLKIPIKNANGTCYRCMKDGHYEHLCHESHDKFGKLIDKNTNKDEINGLDMFFEYKPMG